MGRPIRAKRPDTPDEWWGRPEEMEDAASVRTIKECAEVVIGQLQPEIREDFEPVMRDYVERCEKRLTELEG